MDVEAADFIKCGLAISCGALLGFEREYRNKAAGFRTIILITLGSTLYTIVSQKLGNTSDDRVAANILTGIGFIGAGVIFKGNFSVLGLTTAAVIWISAAIGMLIGSGLYFLGFFSSVLSVIILSIFSWAESYIDGFHHKKTMTITFNNDNLELVKSLEAKIQKANLKFDRVELSKVNNRLQVAIQVQGNKRIIQQLNDELVAMPELFQLQQ